MSDLSGKGLTNQQREFMRVLQEVIMDAGYPASVRQIRIKLKKSDSRVRSHIKVLMSTGYVCCVGRSKVKRYVPSMLWMEDVDAKPEIKENARCVGGYCENEGCNNKAEDTWDGRFLCRSCIVGRDEIQDRIQLREEWLSRCDISSSGGSLFEEKAPDDKRSTGRTPPKKVHCSPVVKKRRRRGVCSMTPSVSMAASAT